MTPERFQRAVDLFEHATHLEPGLCSAFLDKECSEDSELREQLDRMLESDRAGASLLEQPTETLVGAMYAGHLRSLVGHQIQQYQVVSQLGEGGMGIVYLADDTQLGRKAALKVLPEEFASDPRWIAGFQAEARTVSALNHPNIVTIYGLGQDEGLYFLATEYIEGRTLRQHETPCSVGEILDIGRQVAQGMGAAHQAGIVHRDLKPENIIRRDDGLVKILDFGLSRSVCDEGQAPGGAVHGTPDYMAPEQVQGESADHRADIFALGVVLYELLTGRKPFAGDTVATTLNNIGHVSPTPISELRPGIPAPLRTTIERAMAKNPADRYPDMQAMLDDLNRVRSAKPARVWVAAALMLVGILAFAPWRDSQPEVIRGVAVLPLRNVSGEEDQQFFADGLTEQLITDLSKAGTWRVISMPSVMRYASGERDLRRIAQELGVDLLLIGSVLRSGERVRVSTQLVELPDQQNVWAETYERDLKDVLSLQSEIAQAVAAKVRITLTPEERSRFAVHHPVDAETNDLYLQGRFFANKGTEEGLRKGIEFFERTVLRDPKFANAHAGLAFSYSSLANTFIAPRDAMPKAKAAAIRAIELDPSLSEPHALLGLIHLYYDWDVDGAEAELKQAIALNPGSALAHLLYEDMLLAMGRFPEALVETQKSLEADPLSIRVLSEAQFANLLTGRNDEAISLGKKIAALEPQVGVGHVFAGLAYAEKGDLTRAIDELKTAVRLEPSVLAKGFLAHVLALQGDRRAALILLEELKEMNAKRYVCDFEIAVGYATLGETDEAFRMLEEGLRNRADCMVWLKSEPWLRSIRKDPRFEALTGKVGLR